jgi:hypothetical protein
MQLNDKLCKNSVFMTHGKHPVSSGHPASSKVGQARAASSCSVCMQLNDSVFMTQTPPYNGFQAYGGKGALTESWHRGRGLHGVGVGLFYLHVEACMLPGFQILIFFAP